MFVKFKLTKPVAVLGFFLIIFLFGLGENVMAQSKSKSEILITIERTSCFGSCPVYSAKIYADGTVVYKGTEFVKVKGKKQYNISQERIKTLIEEFQKINYFSLKDKYDADENGMSITDQPTTITSISLDGKQKSVVNYYCAPKELEKLEEKIESLANLDEFIGPV
jgi:hypothetical protein